MNGCCRSSKRSSDHSCAGSKKWPKRDIALATLWWIGAALAVLAVASAIGCTRTVLVSEASPIRVGPDCHAKVYTKTEDGWRLSDNRVTIPEGWYCVPPSFVEENR